MKQQAVLDSDCRLLMIGTLNSYRRSVWPISSKTLRSTAAVALGALGLLGALGHAFCGTALPSIQELPDMEGCITMGTRQDFSVDFGFSTFLSLDLARKTATAASFEWCQVKDVDGWPAK